MLKLLKFGLPCAVAAAAFALLAPVASASPTPAFPSPNGIGPLPPTSDSLAFVEGAPFSAGVIELYGGFEKGGESFSGNATTTVVDFSLPQGATIRNDPDLCGFTNLNNYCLIIEENTCADPTGITISGGSIEFKIACDPGQYFVWDSLVNSTLPAGSYDASAQFKVATTKRQKGSPNMWQIPLPGEFVVS